MNKNLSLLVLVLVTAALGVLFFEVISFFLLPLFLATVVVVVFRPLHTHLLEFCRGSRYPAALLATLAMLMAVLLPTLFVLSVAGNEFTRLARVLDDGEVRDKLQRIGRSLGLDYPHAAEFRFAERSLELLLEDAQSGAAATGDHRAVQHLADEWGRLHQQLTSEVTAPSAGDVALVTEAIEQAREAVPGTLEYQLAVESAARRFHHFRQEFLGGAWKTALREIANPTPEDMRLWTSRLMVLTPDRLSSFGSRAGLLFGRFLFGTLIFFLATFFFFADGPRIIRQLMALSPMDDRHEEQLLEDFTRVTRAVVAGTVVAAVAQGVLAGIGFRVAGLSSVFLLTAVTVFLAMIPFVGAASVWLPAGLWLIFVEQRMTAGVGLIIYGATIVSTVDNIIKPWVLHGQSAMHPLAALIGVLGGVQALGPLGVFVGPMVVAFLQTLLRLLHRELAASDDSPASLSSA